MLVLVTRVLRPLVPTVISTELTEQSGGDDRFFVDRLRVLAVGCDEERIGGAVELAHVTSLAVRLAGDPRDFAGHLVEDVRRAATDASVALRAAGRHQKLDHDDPSPGLVSKVDFGRSMPDRRWRRANPGTIATASSR